MPEIFKIRNPEGLFSTGGTYPRFTTEGKTWNKKGHLSNHFANFNEREMFKHYAGCEVVTYRVEVIEVDAEPAEVRMRESVERQRARQAEYQRQAAVYKRDQAVRELQRLSKQFPDLVRYPQEI